jgi:hypothetical protein
MVEIFERFQSRAFYRFSPTPAGRKPPTSRPGRAFHRNPQGWATAADIALERRNIMLKVFLTQDPQTLRALYDSEAKLLGIFQSMCEAQETLGDMLNFCSIRYTTYTVH